MRIQVKENRQEAVEGITLEYPYAYHYVDMKKTRIPWHWHEELELGYVLQGSLTVTTAEKDHQFEKGQGFFMNTNVLSSMSRNGESCVLESHLFHWVLLGGHFKSIFETKYMAPVLQDRKIDIVEIRGRTTREKELLKKIHALSVLQAQEDVEFQTRNLLGEIWILLGEEIKGRSFSRPRVSLASQERLQVMLAYIQKNYDKKITLEELAAEASVSPRECLRCFRECIHKTPMEYLLDHRVEMAKQLLKTTEMSITQIAYGTGFSSPAYFAKVFRESAGATPSLYRAREKETSV
ncbi:MAG: AraC family transcriptional regulator [Eubacteriales bacterium]|nr:AraC family transcriptional regulator [Eubacteriales bacterium]